MQPLMHEVEWQMRRFELLRKVTGNKIVAAAGLERGRLPILEYVRAHDGTSQREIADMLHVSPASVAVSVRRMEKDGLVHRRSDPKDHRVNRIHITSKGSGKVDQCMKAFWETTERMLGGFDEKELAALRDTFAHLFDNLSGDTNEAFPFFLNMYAMHAHAAEEALDD